MLQLWLGKVFIKKVSVDTEDVKSVQEEERNLFIKYILENIGVPLHEVWPDLLITLEQKTKLRRLLSSLNLEIIYDGDHGVKIYGENQLLAEWFKPKIIMKKDEVAKDLKKSYFYEIEFKMDSIFDKDA